jgi:hypothetical protein
LDRTPTLALSFSRQQRGSTYSVGRAAGQGASSPLAFGQEADDLDADDGDFLEVQRGARAACVQLAPDLLEIPGPDVPDQAEDPSPAVRTPLEPEGHPSARLDGDAQQAAGHLSGSTCLQLLAFRSAIARHLPGV